MTYQELKDTIEKSGKSLPLSAENDRGEYVIIEEGKREDGVHYYRTTTAQDNDWCKIIYLYADDVVEELYER